MLIRGSVRRKSKEVFQRVLILRKQGYSYTEIRKETGIAKSTINNWLTYAGLTLTKEHLEIQFKKRLENKKVASEASKRTRQKRNEESINRTIEAHKKYFNDPFYNFCVALYEAEGAKGTDCKFSNSDYRLVQTFVKFIERYFFLKRSENMIFEIYIHKTRADDLEKIQKFWLKKLNINVNNIRIYWKNNSISGRKMNPEYVGQMLVRVRGEKILGRKIQAISDIILSKYQRY